MALRIGEILVKKEIINEAQLTQALEEQSKTGKFLGSIIVDLGFSTEEGILTALADQFSTRFVSLENVQINPVVLKLVPRSIVWEYHFMPIEMRADVMLIAVSNPLDMWPISFVRDKFRLSDVQIVLALQKDIEQAIWRHYGPDTGDVDGG